MKHIIYADNAATTELDPKAFEIMKAYLIDEYANPSQPYSSGRRGRELLKQARAIIADCIGASSQEIYFTSGGTESDNWAIKGSAFCDYSKRATIASAIEHHAVYNACCAIERMGYPVAYLMPDGNGLISPKKLEDMITDKTRLVSIMMVNNEIGSIEPIKQLCEVAHRYGAIFHTDAVQAVGHIKIDVKELGVDMLSASAHKFNGPKGAGFLYIKEGTKIAPLLDGGSQESGQRAGTENVASIMGMAVALKENCSNLDANSKKISDLQNVLLNRLLYHGIAFKQNGQNTMPGILSLSFANADGEAILHRLDLMGISISTGAACDSVKTEISHVLRAIKLDESNAKGTIRISLGKNNTEQDATDIADALYKIICP